MKSFKFRGNAMNWLKLLFAISVLTTATGCWDEVDLQDVSYATAIGIDYVDEQFGSIRS